MTVAPLFERLRETTEKIIVCQGGGDAAKTVSILQVLAVAAVEEPNITITIEGEDIPNLKGGALRSFQKYAISSKEIDYYIQKYNIQDRIYTFRNKSIVEFKSFDNEEDARGSERDYLYMNECNTRPYNLFWQLQRKTRKQVLLDYNPTHKFWVHNKLLDKNTMDTQFVGKVKLYITDHRHNPFLTAEQHQDYENISDPETFRVYARGLTGKTDGIIYNFKKVDRIPEGLPFGFGVDFGYNSDKTAIVKIYFDKRDRYWQQLLYKSENQILDYIRENNLDVTKEEFVANILKNNGCVTSSLVVGDHDKMWSAGLRRHKIPFRMAKKGPNSVAPGISKVKSYNNYYFDSPDIEKELETYVWEKAIDQLTGKEVLTTNPIDGMPDDLLAAGRYLIRMHSLRYDNNQKQEEDEEPDEEND